MKSLKPKEVLKILQKKGFYIHHQRGSHVVLKNYQTPARRVVVPMHNKDLKIGTLLSILNDAGISKEEI